MRLFLAIPLPDAVKESLYEQTEPWRKEYPYLKWVPQNNYHITLFFFGDQFPASILKDRVENVTFDTRSFHLFSGENGIMMRNSLILYAGFLKSQSIEQLVKRIKAELNIVDDLKFFPHLTLARYRIPSKQQYLLLKKKWLKTHFDIEFEVSQITLYESVIEKNVPVYTPQTTFPLLSRADY